MRVPSLDAVVDIGAPLALLWYWWTFFRNARRGPPEKPAPRRRLGLSNIHMTNVDMTRRRIGEKAPGQLRFGLSASEELNGVVTL